ncbi:MAG TPA: DUF3189 family protein [Syntrophomonadaceae bacterium]|nr:DUF3189 family protein [Syntrophomonadaceae bacterium]
MKILYHCFGGSHSSVLAASLHLGLISKERLPTMQEMMALPYFDKTSQKDFGSIRFMGVDEGGNEVYVLGKKSLGDRYNRIFKGVAALLGKPDEIVPVDCMSRVNISMKLGGFASRRVGWVRLGRPVLGQGTRKAFLNLVNLVEITRVQVMNKLQVN